KAAGLFVDVEVLEQRLAVAEHIEDPAAHAAAALPLRAEVELREVQDHRVSAARIDRNRIVEMAEAFGAEELRVIRACHRLAFGRAEAVEEIVIRSPTLTLVVDE